MLNFDRDDTRRFSSKFGATSLPAFGWLQDGEVSMQPIHIRQTKSRIIAEIKMRMFQGMGSIKLTAEEFEDPAGWLEKELGEYVDRLAFVKGSFDKADSLEFKQCVLLPFFFSLSFSSVGVFLWFSPF